MTTAATDRSHPHAVVDAPRPGRRLEPLPWSNEQAIAIRDANIDITRVLTQFLGMDMATSMDEFQQVHADRAGHPVGEHDRHQRRRPGLVRRHVGDAEPVARSARSVGGRGRRRRSDRPRLQRLRCRHARRLGLAVRVGRRPGRPGAGPRAVRRRAADRACRLRVQRQRQLLAEQPRRAAHRVLPDARRRRRAAVAADAHEHDAARGARPGRGRSTTSRRRCSPSAARSPSCCGSRSSTPARRRPRSTSTATIVDLAAACATLAAWDGTFTLDASGAILFREWLSRFDYGDRTDAGRLFADAFDPANPATTPSTPVDDRSEWLVELGSAVQLLELLGIPIDAPLGDWQFEVRTGDRIPIRGGTGHRGRRQHRRLLRRRDDARADPRHGESVNDQSATPDLPGYLVSDGSSFVMALEFTADGPVAEGFLTYGNPDDPAGTGLPARSRSVERRRMAAVPVPARGRRLRVGDGDHRAVGSSLTAMFVGADSSWECTWRSSLEVERISARGISDGNDRGTTRGRSRLIPMSGERFEASDRGRIRSTGASSRGGERPPARPARTR